MARRASIALFALAACGDPPVPETAPPHYAATDAAVATCGACHLDVYLEWNDSLHREAWTNNSIQVATKGFSIVECRPCHSPEPMIERPLAERPIFRPENLEDGVHCVSCHGLAGGGVAAIRDIPGAPCRPRRIEALADRMMCNPCHEPTHGAMTEFVTSQAFRFGQTCQDCHMPRVERKGGVWGRSHGPLGGLNPDFIRTGLHWSCRLEPDAVVVTLGNQTGHKFPGEIATRSLQVVVNDESRVYRKPFKGEVGWTDNRLTPNEFREIRFARTGPVRVRILFKPYPLMPDEDAFVLADWNSDS